MIKKFIVSTVVFSLMMVVGISQVKAENDNVSTTIKVDNCMQTATMKKKIAFENVQNTFLIAIKNSKENGELAWWPWTKGKIEARKIRKNIKITIMKDFSLDQKNCQKNLKEQSDKDDNQENNDKEDKEISLNFSVQNNSSIYGTAKLEDEDGNVEVKLELINFSSGIIEPAHIHLGACPNPGAVKYPLNSVLNGESKTVLNGMTIAQLKTQLPLAINVHKSQEEMSVSIACVDLKF